MRFSQEEINATNKFAKENNIQMAPKKTRTILLEFDCQLDDGGLDEFIQNFASGRHVNLKDAVVFDEVMDGVLEELLEED